MSTYSQFLQTGTSYATPGALFPGYGTAQRYPLSSTGVLTKSSTLTANKLLATRFFCRATTTFSAIAVYQNGAGTMGNIRLGIYNDSTGLPGTLKQDVGAVAFPGSTGWRTVAASITLQGPTWYWSACVADAALVVIGPDAATSAAHQIPRLAEVLDTGLSTVIGGSPDWGSNVNGLDAVRASLTYGALPTPFGTLEAYDQNSALMFLVG